EGMDHALVGDSSQRPGENYGVEGVVTVVELLCVARPKTNSASELRRQVFARIGDKLGVAITRVHACAKPGETKGEAATAATELEDTLATPIGDIFERPNFILFRING